VPKSHTIGSATRHVEKPRCAIAHTLRALSRRLATPIQSRRIPPGDRNKRVWIVTVIRPKKTEPLPTEVGTLDAIHLATALLWREASNSKMIMVTHGRALATAAKRTD
jgi:hypothetical protein